MPTATTPQQIDEKKVHAFLGQVVGDFGAALSSALVYIGQVLGLYKAMADGRPATSAELARRTGTDERYVREWLINQASGGYVAYDPAAETYHLTPEQAVVLTDEESPFYAGGGFYVVKALSQAQGRIAELFKTGGGMLWKDHDADLFAGTERFFRPGYAAHLTTEWIPALDGIEARLRAGGSVADIGCGHGASTLIMAKAYPQSRFFGFDSHDASIRRARQAAEEAGLAGRVRFDVSDACSVPDQRYDLAAFFDCLHDMANPVGALKRVHAVLKEDGAVLLVEPMAGERVEENFNPVGRTFSAASTLCCTANSLAMRGPALGAVATEAALRDVASQAGFRHFRRAAATPFNRIFELRK